MNMTRKFTQQEKEENYEFFQEEYLDKYPASGEVPDMDSRDYIEWLICNEGYL